ncbi:MAG: hypothetical protein GYB67_18360 [Chloroflexi bacterium]|nr:hypothetical protein [Chloroflexota bacterium]
MRKRGLLIALLLIMQGAGIVSAQPEDDNPKAEIYAAIDRFDAVFGPDVWRYTASDQPVRTTVFWLSQPLNGVGYLDILRYRDGFGAGAAAEFLANLNTWFAAVLSNYQPWTLKRFCNFGGLLLYEFDGTFSDEPYAIRYWFDQIAPDAVLTMQLLMPARLRTEFEGYAAQLFPDASSCAPG